MIKKIWKLFNWNFKENWKMKNQKIKKQNKEELLKILDISKKDDIERVLTFFKIYIKNNKSKQCKIENYNNNIMSLKKIIIINWNNEYEILFKKEYIEETNKFKRKVKKMKNKIIKLIANWKEVIIINWEKIKWDIDKFEKIKWDINQFLNFK